MKEKTTKENIWNGILIIYFLLMARILLFKNFTPFELLNINRTVYRMSNLIPFASIKLFYFTGPGSNIFISILNVIGNIIIFIPIGMYLQIYSKTIENKWWEKNQRIINCSFNVFLISLSIELVQYFFGIGIADVDDIMLNTIGGVIGIFIYRILFKLFKNDEKVKTAIICLVFLSAILSMIIYAYAKSQGIKIRVF